MRAAMDDIRAIIAGRRSKTTVISKEIFKN